MSNFEYSSYVIELRDCPAWVTDEVVNEVMNRHCQNFDYDYSNKYGNPPLWHRANWDYVANGAAIRFFVEPWIDVEDVVCDGWRFATGEIDYVPDSLDDYGPLSHDGEELEAAIRDTYEAEVSAVEGCLYDLLCKIYDELGIGY